MKNHTFLKSFVFVSLLVAGASFAEARETAYTVSPQSGIAPLSVTFENSLAPREGEYYQINFGDGTREEMNYCGTASEGCISGPGKNTHTYHTPGTYQATVSSSEWEGQSPLAVITVTASAALPEGSPESSFKVTPRTGIAPHTVTVSFPCTKYELNWGDGTNEEGDGMCPQSVRMEGPLAIIDLTHTYADPGTYTMTWSTDSGASRETTLITVGEEEQEANTSFFGKLFDFFLGIFGL